MAQSAIFWHGESRQDTLMIERIAGRVFTEIFNQIPLLEPDLLRKSFPEEIFFKSHFSSQLFFSAYPNGTRYDILFRSFASLQSAIVYTHSQFATDSIRFIYPLSGVNTADWFEFHIQNHILKKDQRQDFFFGGNAKLKIDGTPIGADVYLNGVATGQKIPCEIENLLPITYLVELIGAYCGAEKVKLIPNGTAGVTIRGKPSLSLLEVLSEPSGLEIEVDGDRSGFTPYYRELSPGGVMISVGGDNRELLSKRVEVNPLEWKTIQFVPRIMYRVVLYSNPPGAAIYSGPLRIGTAGDTLPCSPNGEVWRVDHPYANPKEIQVTGDERDIVVLHVALGPAEGLLRLKNWYPVSTLRYNGKALQVTNPDSLPVLAGKSIIEISTPGFLSKRIDVELQRGEFYDLNAEPVPAPDWRSAIYSLAFPGLGQYLDGDWKRAGVYGIAFLTSAIFWNHSEKQVKEAVKSANFAEMNYQRSLTVYKAQFWSNQADQRWSEAEKFQSTRNSWAIATLAFWGASALDRVVLPSKSIAVVPSTKTNGLELQWYIR